MDLDDRKTIQTPEGLDLDLTLAGLGSRMIAAVVDTVLIGLLIFLLLFGASQLAVDGFGSGIVVQAAITIVVTLVILGYLVGFEALNEGRTPGKRSVGIRVVTVEGDSIGFLAAFLRNLLRVIDFLPAVFIVGAASILLTKTNQRVGDITANTIVIRERLPHVDRAEHALARAGERLRQHGERRDAALGADRPALHAGEELLRGDRERVLVEEAAIAGDDLHAREVARPDRLPIGLCWIVGRGTSECIFGDRFRQRRVFDQSIPITAFLRWVSSQRSVTATM